MKCILSAGYQMNWTLQQELHCKCQYALAGKVEKDTFLLLPINDLFYFYQIPSTTVYNGQCKLRAKKKKKKRVIRGMPA